jgi:CPA2 family monovalent cation:H+ antiporter-2
MHGAHVLVELVIVLGIAAVTTLVFQALRQPVVLGYILAGLAIGPFTHFPLVADAQLVGTLSELGVILLMFSIGLEFSIRTIAKVGVPAALTAALEVAMMVTLGWLVGAAFGWSGVERLFLGAAVGISSTMLAARALEGKKRTGFVELVYAILVFEDLLAIVLLAVLTAVSSGSGLSAAGIARLIGELTGFLALMLIAGLLVIPRLVRIVATRARGETLLITALAICFGMALVAERAGYSVALGAFLAGMLVAESGRGHEVDLVIAPFRDVFGAIFFVSVGMTIDPSLIAEHWLAILILTVVVIVGKTLAVTVSAFLAGNGLPRAVRASLSLAQIGELSFVIAGLGVATGTTRPFLLAILVGVSCLTAFAGPWLIRGGDSIATALDQRLPGPIHTFVTFYGSWIERLRSTRRDSLWTRLRGRVAILVVDVALLVAVLIGASIAMSSVPRLGARVELSASASRVVLYAVAALLAVIFLIGVIRAVRRLAHGLAAEIIPPGPDGQLDLGTAPRRVLVLALELGLVLGVGFPASAVLQPFVPMGGLVPAVAVLVLAFAGWRATANLHGHVSAGSELIVEALSRQRRQPTERLADVEALLPGFAGLAPVTLVATSPAVGLTLAALNLRAITGASVLAITREGGGTASPKPDEMLQAGDTLALAGSDEAVAAARAILLESAARLQ